MPNGVKYSTTTPSGSLRRDNVALGVTSNLGPTANTGFYSMPAPQSGKYIINKVSPSGIPNFFAPANDAELIRLARIEGATGANTGSVAAVLAWMATQDNLEAVNFEYPNIITDGLVLNLDAGFVGSYPTTGTPWYDLSGNSNNGILNNGPTFNSANSGSIVFDGVDDYWQITYNTSIKDHTIMGFLNLNTLTGKDWICVFEFGSPVNSGVGPHYYIQGLNNIYPSSRTGFGANFVNGTTSNETWGDTNLSTVTPGNWIMVTGRINGTLGDTFINTSKSKPTKTLTNWSSPTTVTSLKNNRTGAGDYYYNGNLSNVLLYNRALSDNEILQNYNALKGRFGL